MATSKEKTSRKSLSFFIIKKLKQIFFYCQWLVVHFFTLLIRTYQLFISPLIGQNCRFYPSCSHYCHEALIEHGVIKGSWLGIKRILRCHPGSAGGLDPVPKKSCHHHG